MSSFTANGVEIAFDQQGPENGPPIVFANSLGTDMRIWEKVLPLLPVGLRKIRYDERGQGRSATPPAPYTVADHAADLDALLDHLGLSGVALVGLSIGGMIAEELCAADPGRIRALVLMDTAPRIATADFWNTRIAAVKEGGMEAVAEAVLDRWFSTGFRENRAAELAHWRDMLVASPAEGYVGSCAALRDADTAAAVRSIAVPTLVMCGSEDAPTPPQTVKAMADMIPNSRFVEIAGSGHLPCIEASAIVGFQIGAFLKEHGIV